jgi:hypothetical protein
MSHSPIIQQYVPVIYAGSLKPISLGIMVADRIWFSHVAFDCVDHVLEARGGHGVVETPIEEFLLRYGWVKRGLYPTAVHPDDCMAKARSLIGYDYDEQQIFRMAVGSETEVDLEPKKLICTEYIATCTQTPNPAYWHRYRIRDAYRHTIFEPRNPHG